MDAGVDIAAGAELVERIAPDARATARPGSLGGLGGFGGLFDVQAAGYRDPLLVAATDGVGTKLMLAADVDCHDTVGQDLVAMCVNDLLVQGAEPLFFLDYFATGKLSVAQAASVVHGIADGCRAAGCALIGGETAEMPGLYRPGDYDLAGFAVGAVERDGLLPDLAALRPGDAVLALGASGPHANGYSLIRRIVAARGHKLDAPAPFDASQSLGAALLTPTRIYVRPVLAALKHGSIRALAHITGGGLIENLPRVLPEGVGVRLDAGAWPLPAVFGWLAAEGQLAPEEMARTFNCGLGMALIVPESAAAETMALLAAAGEQVWRVGEIVAGSGVEIRGIERWRG